MYNQLFWEVSGKCNSRCYYCPSGTRNPMSSVHNKGAGFISLRLFTNGIEHLERMNTIKPGHTQFNLYNWGEPFLHPQFEDILNIVVSKGYRFALSTNASVLKLIPDNLISNLDLLIFSISGFSQSSYDRMHGFNFETIKDNIRKINKPIRDYFPPHIYNTRVDMLLSKFNVNELDLAKEFCNSEGINFNFKYMHTIGYTPVDESDIFTEHISTIKNRQPVGYMCPQFNVLVLDEHCNVMQCCVLDRMTTGNVVSNLWDIDFDMLPTIRRNAKVCIKCKETKTGYLCHNSQG